MKRRPAGVGLSDYRIFETAGFQRDLAGLGPETAKRIQDTLTRRVYPVLRAAPREAPSAARLKNWDPPTWRIRIGPWRVFYEIDDEKRVVFLTAAISLLKRRRREARDRTILNRHSKSLNAEALDVLEYQADW